MKRIFALIILLAMISGMAVFADNQRPSVFVDGEAAGYRLLFRGDSLLVEAALFEKLGASLQIMNPLVIVTGEMSTIVARIGDGAVYINGARRETEASELEGGTAYLPLRAVCEGLGRLVLWNESEKAVYIGGESEEMPEGIETADLILSRELVALPDFEGNFMFTGEWENYAKSIITSTTAEARSGIRSGSVIERTSPWHAISQDITSVLNEYGKGKYRISGWVKTADSPQLMTIKTAVTNADGARVATTTLIEAVPDEWREGSGIVDITWEGEISKALIYSESGSDTGVESEWQTFYVDDFSLKKVLDKPENIDLPEDEESVDSGEDERIAELVDKHKDKAAVTVYPKESHKILQNPYRGYAFYSSGGEFTDEMLSNTTAEISGIGYARYDWSRLEPSEGVYDWAIIDNNLEVLKRHNLMFGIGIGGAANITYSDMSSSSGTVWAYQSTPLWVFEAGAKYTEELEGKLKIPVWSDPVFMEKMANFIKAFAERYNGHPGIAFVDARNYGNWGEWHLLNLPNSKEASLETKKKLTDMWQPVELPVAVLHGNNADVVRYGLNTLEGSAFRLDGTMDPAGINNHKQIAHAYGIGAGIAEWIAPGYTGYKPGEMWADQAPYMPVLFERVITEGKVSYIGLSDWTPVAFYNENKEMVDRMANKQGYWFKPSKIQYPQALTEGLFQMRIKNDGVAPIYSGYDKKAYVKLALIDSANKVIDIVTLEGVDPSDWMPDEWYNIAEEYEFTNKASNARLAIGLFTHENYESPDIELGIEGTMVDKWYILSSMPSNDDGNLAANKIYFANEESGEFGYGFHRAAYAFDNRPETYWQCEGNAGDYLMVDFGETKNISGIHITGFETARGSFVLQCLENGRWVEAASFNQIQKGGTELKFRSKKADAVRLYIKNSTAGRVAVTEFIIKR